MGIPAIPLENFINKILKILSVEGSSLIPIGLKNQLQLGNILQGEVVRLLPKEKAEISIEGQKFIAEIPDLKLKLQENPRKTPSKFPFKSGHKIYIQVEKMNPEPVLKLVSSPQQKIQEKGDTTNLSRDIKPEIIKSENLRELKLPPDKIVLVTVNQIINDRSMSVNSEFNKFIVKTKNADFYRPGEKVRIQFQNVDKGFKPILIDHPDKIQKIDIELIKPYLPSRKPLGKLVGELIRDILGSPVLKELNVKIICFVVLLENISV